MENFKILAESLFTKFETRMWRKEKDAFLEHCKTEFAKLGYDDSDITIKHNRNMFGLTSKNLLVGSPDADILITAHYDTPGNNGFLLAATPIVGMKVFNILFFVIIVGAAFFRVPLQSAALDILFNVFIILMVVFSIIKNKHNHNDNTSGVLGVFNMAALAAGNPELRKKCAFELFDHEELGLVGSHSFAKWRKKNYPGKENVAVINFDCIGNGDVLVVMTKKEHQGWNQIADFLQCEGFDVVRTRSSALTASSDHAHFPMGVSLLYQKRSLLGPPYIPKIHTGGDTVCDLEGIDKLCASIYKYISDKPSGTSSNSQNSE